MATVGQDTLKTRRTLNVGDKEYDYYSLSEAEKKLGDISRLPYSMKVLLENLLRYEDGVTVSTDDVQAIIDWQKEKRMNREIQYRPARVLMQDFTGVPAVVDLAAMRNAVVSLGGNPEQINPLSPVDLVIDHSVMVDNFGSNGAFQKMLIWKCLVTMNVINFYVGVKTALIILVPYLPEQAFVIRLI